MSQFRSRNFILVYKSNYQLCEMSAVNNYASVYTSNITTKVQSTTSPTVTTYDSSSITASFTPGINYGGGGQSLTYNILASSGGVSLSGGPTISTLPGIVTGLSGNTSYTVNILTSIGVNGAFSLAATPTTTTYVQPVSYISSGNYNPSGLWVDSSSIGVQYTPGKNTGVALFNEYVYTGTGTNAVYFGTAVGGTSSTSTALVTGLSGCTNYVVNVKTTIGSNVAISGNLATTTSLQPAYGVSGTLNDGGSINFAFNAGNNSGTTTYTAYAYDSSNQALFFIAGPSPLLITGLSGNTLYNCSMTTVNVNGGTAFSSNIGLTTSAQPPYTLTQGATDISSIQVSFQTGSNYSSTAPLYTIYTTTGISVTGSSSPLTLTGLASGISYNIYGTVTLNGGGVSASSSSALNVSTTVQYLQCSYFRFNSYHNLFRCYSNDYQGSRISPDGNKVILFPPALPTLITGFLYYSSNQSSTPIAFSSTGYSYVQVSMNYSGTYTIAATSSAIYPITWTSASPVINAQLTLNVATTTGTITGAVINPMATVLVYATSNNGFYYAYNKTLSASVPTWSTFTQCIAPVCSIGSYTNISLNPSGPIAISPYGSYVVWSDTNASVPSIYASAVTRLATSSWATVSQMGAISYSIATDLVLIGGGPTGIPTSLLYITSVTVPTGSPLSAGTIYCIPWSDGTMTTIYQFNTFLNLGLYARFVSYDYNSRIYFYGSSEVSYLLLTAFVLPSAQSSYQINGAGEDFLYYPFNNDINNYGSGGASNLKPYYITGLSVGILPDSWLSTDPSGAVYNVINGDANFQTITTAGTYGSVYSNGNGALVDTSLSMLINYTTGFTVAFWFYSTSDTTGMLFSINNGTLGSGYDMRIACFLNGRVGTGTQVLRFFGVRDSSIYWTIAGAYSLNKWYHVAFVYQSDSGGSTTCYLNGYQLTVATGSANTNPDKSVSSQIVYYPQSNTYTYLSFFCDENNGIPISPKSSGLRGFHLYNTKALSATQIADMFKYGW